jgi:hypothetical protein
MVTIILVLLIASCSQASTVTVTVPPSTVTIPLSTTIVTKTVISTVTVPSVSGTSQSNSTTASTPTTTANLITQDASTLALSLKDLPVGWTFFTTLPWVYYYIASQSSDTPPPPPAISNFTETFMGTSYSLDIFLNVFSTVDEAKNEYSTELTLVQAEYSTTNPEIGQESIAYSGSYNGCFFRESNVVVKVETRGNISSLNDTVTFAQQQEAKIVGLAK